MKTYLKPTEDTVWPNPVVASTLSCSCRYNPNTLTREDYLVIASVLDAYVFMIDYPPKGIRKTLQTLNKLALESTNE